MPVAGAWPGRTTGLRAERPKAYHRAWGKIGKPRTAWSSFTGQWRSVEIPDTPIVFVPGRRSARSAEARFDGQVIARWVAGNGDGGHDYGIAIDDGDRAWNFEVGPILFDRVRLRDMVDVRLVAHSTKLLDLTRTGRSADARLGRGGRGR